MNIHYTEDYENIPSQGVVFYNDPDETVMELWKDGEVKSSCYIDDFCEEHGLDMSDKTYVYDQFIKECEGWV